MKDKGILQSRLLSLLAERICVYIYIYAIELTSKDTIERIFYLLVSRKLVGIVFK